MQYVAYCPDTGAVLSDPCCLDDALKAGRAAVEFGKAKAVDVHRVGWKPDPARRRRIRYALNGLPKCVADSRLVWRMMNSASLRGVVKPSEHSRAELLMMRGIELARRGAA